MSRPPVNSWGRMITGIIWTAWNSVAASEDERLERGENCEGERVPEHEVASPDGRCHQPLEGAGLPLAQRRDAGDQEHHEQREDAQEQRAEPVDHGGALEHPGDK